MNKIWLKVAYNQREDIYCNEALNEYYISLDMVDKLYAILTDDAFQLKPEIISWLDVNDIFFTERTQRPIVLNDIQIGFENEKQLMEFRLLFL